MDALTGYLAALDCFPVSPQPLETQTPPLMLLLAVSILGIFSLDLAVSAGAAPPTPSGVTIIFAGEVAAFCSAAHQEPEDSSHILIRAAPATLIIAKLSGGKHAIICAPSAVLPGRPDQRWIILPKNTEFRIDEATLSVAWIQYGEEGDIQQFSVKLHSAEDFWTFVQRSDSYGIAGPSENTDAKDEEVRVEDELEVMDICNDFDACVDYGAFDERLTHAWDTIRQAATNMLQIFICYILMSILIAGYGKALAMKGMHGPDQ
ncbi:hypothetical protein EVJ58_g6567 [Rhodofomes roseus]|uniref:Uncharacterized protein n=1 Tax=Rhodofomes roseus TaxID=34475 RepID=A0A4Y9Y7N3_9APHY|nr:hypothetical protein EVJ58_g6567 [Rhodofomes roseus]